MKILIGTSSPIDRGSGINSYVREIAAAFRINGHEITIACPQVEDSTWLEQHSIPLLPMSELVTPEDGVRLILDSIRSSAYDAIINNDNPYLQSVAPVVECPFLSVMHLGYRSIASLACFNSRWVDHVVAISNEMRSRAISKYRVKAGKVCIVYNGIMDPVPNVEKSARHGERLKVVFNGGGNRRKGFDLLYKSLTHYPTEWELFDLEIFGHVDEKYAKYLRSRPHITLHGRVPHDHMMQEVSKADVFLLPSRFEGCPMALIEAMAFGLVPIVSDGDGAMDVMVQSGVSGFVCQLSDWAKQAIECLQLLRSNDGMRMQMGKEARLQYEQNYHSSLTASRLLSLIDSPTVDRTVRPDTIDLLHWHRPTVTRVRKMDIVQRLRIRVGVLKHKNRAWKVSRVVD